MGEMFALPEDEEGEEVMATWEIKTPTVTIREVMDIHETAAYLGVSEDTLYNYAADGALPGFKLGNRWRFRKLLLDEWMDKQCATNSKKGKVKNG